ncbi:hypothetical protein ACWKWN_15210 [Microbacterium trichothecenolyticum]
MTPTPTPNTSPVRIRWGWFVTCIVLGLAAITIGAFAIPAAGRWDYFAGVLANIGTTLLLVGVVLLLERRIIDTAVRVVRTASQQTNEAIRTQIRDLEDRLATEWQSATAENVAEKKARTTRLTEEFTKRIVDETKRDE